MMQRLLLASTLVVAATAKTYIFNAAKCNTNFANLENWANPDATAVDGVTMDTPVSGAVPEVVEFSSRDGSFQPVNVRVNGGNYEMGKLKLQRNMKIMLDVEGVAMKLNSEAQGSPSFFIAGQDTSNAACSLGCHKNYFEYLGRGGAEGAVEVNLDEFSGDGVVFDQGSPIVPAAQTPCNIDTVVVPKRYGVNLLAIGFHPFKELVYPASEERLVTVESAADIPLFMFFPTSNKKVFLGPDVMDECTDHGLVHDDKCICISECPAPKDALTESNKLRVAAKAFAQRELTAYNSQNGRERVSFTFVNAFDPANVDSVCRVDRTAIADLVKEYTGNHLDSQGIDTDVDVDTATITATGIITGRVGDFQNQKLLPQTDIGILPSVTLPGSGYMGPPTEAPNFDLKDEVGYQLAMTVYHAVIDEMAAQCRLRGSADLLEEAGIERVRQERTVVFGGSNLPQIDVNRLVDANNRAGVIDHVFEGVKDIQGFEDLSKQALATQWGLATPEDRTKGRRAARLGLATNLVRCNLEYSRWSTGSGVDVRHVEQVINHLLATYDTQTHHQCFTFEGGYDDECIGQIVTKAIEMELTACDPAKVADCSEDAAATALGIIMEIKGCGLLGTIVTASGVTQCADPEAEAANEALADSFAANLTSDSVEQAENQYASSVQSVVNKRIAEEEARVDAALNEMLGINASATERADRAQRIALEQKALALEFSSQASEEEVEARLLQSEQEVATKDDEFRKSWEAFMQCLDSIEAARDPDFDCNRAEKIMWARMDNLKAVTEFNRIIQSKHVKMTLESAGTNDKGNYVIEKEDRAALIIRADAIAQQAITMANELRSVESKLSASADELEAAGCDNPAALDEAGVKTCSDLRKKRQALAERSVMLQSQIATLEGDAADINSSAEAAAAPDTVGFFGETLNLIIVVAGGLIFIIIVIGMTLVCKAPPAASGGWDDGNQNVVAFENPMYDDPAQMGGMAPVGEAAQFENPNYDAPEEQNAGAAGGGDDDEDGGLYDEPEYDSGEVAGEEAGGGYLDVEADSDDDDSDEESDSDDSDEEEEAEAGGEEQEEEAGEEGEEEEEEESESEEDSDDDDE